MSNKIDDADYSGEMKNFARWVLAELPIREGESPSFRRPHLYTLRNDDPGDISRLFDHGFVTGRVLELSETLGIDLYGIEFGIVARTYATEMIDSPPQGLRVIRLPYAESHGTPVLIVPQGPGPGTIGFLYALRDMSADYFSCALPIHLSQKFRIAIGYEYNAPSQMSISLIPRKD